MSIIITENGKNASRLDRTKFVDENELQEYLYENPDVVPIYEIEDDRELLILSREFHTNSGPIDALGVDIRGNLYIVETKLYKNPDKRTVIAQALDYGAAMWAYYEDYSDFISILNRDVSNKFDMSLSQKLEEFFELDSEAVEQLLDNVKENLNKGIFKFVILMDELDPRLKDLIRFINQNSQFDVYAVELEYYKFNKHELMIPKIFGAEVKKDLSVGSRNNTSARKKWDKKIFFSELEKNVSSEGYKLSKELYTSLEELGDLGFGTGTSVGSYSMRMSTNKGKQTIMHQWTDGRLEALSGYFSENSLSDKYKDKILATIKPAKYNESKNWYRVDIQSNDLTKQDILELIEIYKEIKEDLLS